MIIFIGSPLATESMGKHVSKRLATRDYRQPGKCFITICTHRRAHYFGKCSEGEMLLSPIGKVIDELWYTIPVHHEEVSLGAFVVVPNSLHGVLEILPPATATYRPKTLLPFEESSQYVSQISPTAGRLSQIGRSFKSAVMREVRLRGFQFQ